MTTERHDDDLTLCTVRIGREWCCSHETQLIERTLGDLAFVKDFVTKKSEKLVTVTIVPGSEEQLLDALKSMDPSLVTPRLDSVEVSIGRKWCCCKETKLIHRCLGDLDFVKEYTAVQVEKRVAVAIVPGSADDLVTALNAAPYFMEATLVVQCSVCQATPCACAEACQVCEATPCACCSEACVTCEATPCACSEDYFSTIDRSACTVEDFQTTGEPVTPCEACVFCEATPCACDYGHVECVTTPCVVCEATPCNCNEGCVVCEANPCTCEAESDHLQPVKTRLTVANMCCELESRLIKETLELLPGVHQVKTNVIGRVAYVVHDSTVKTTDLVDALNAKRLGAAIGTATATADAEADDGGSFASVAVGFVVVVFVGLSTLYVLSTSNDDGAWASREAHLTYEGIILAMACAGAAIVARKAGRSIFVRHSLDVNVLMLVAFAGAVALGDYVEAATVVIVFVVADHLEGQYMRRVRRALRDAAASSGASHATLVDGRRVAVEDLRVGDVFAARAGESVPADGVIVDGSAAFDESCLTGESVPLEKTKGAAVVAGSIVVSGYAEVRVDRPATESAIAKMQTLVDEAQASSSPTQALITRFATYFTPTALVAAVVVFAAPTLAGGDSNVWLRNALVLLVVACPCALVAAAPIAIVSSVAAAAKRGVLIKSGDAVEALATVSVVCTDKTGTLTQGRCRVVEASWTAGVEDPAALRLAAALETRSSHPLATAVVNYAMGGCAAEAADEKLTDDVVDFRTLGGLGVAATVDGRAVAVGSAALVGLELYDDDSDTTTRVYISIDGAPVARLTVYDPIRDEAYDAVARLKKRADVVIVTGDRPGPARFVAAGLPSVAVKAGLKPNDKFDVVRSAQADGKVVLMIGDGVNDAPALAAADVGVAMGAGGTALAVDAADVAVMNDDLGKLCDAIDLAVFARTLIAENIGLALGLKLAVVAAVFADVATLWMAVLADVLSLLVVIANGLRPLSYYPAVVPKLGSTADDDLRHDDDDDDLEAPPPPIVPTL